ncbi:MAG: 23S rRNA (guanosine(2251)-2'-O)-methyltransferase RlmB [Treponema sp.]|nr:23S rRNA (guanosine(2251)-2'-O)-methyltransferase RlmB [Treponema sp.]
MPDYIITGFHAVEERIRRAAESGATAGLSVQYGTTGPRVKKILELAKKAGIPAQATDDRALDALVQHLPPVARDHRGIVLIAAGENGAHGGVDFDQWVASCTDDSRRTVVLLDSITDPHNVGAILRSCDQFGADLVVMPQRRGMSDIASNEIIARSSAGASSWVAVAVVTNLVRAAQQLKAAGFWLYGADAGGQSVQSVTFAQKTALVMGSEGTGIARLLREQCDGAVSIPTCGKIDSLNVSVAAGVLLYERYRQGLCT